MDAFFCFKKKVYIYLPPNQILMNTPDFRVTTDLHANKEKRFLNFLIDYIVKIVVGIVLAVLITLISEYAESYAIYDFLIESESRLSDYIFGAIVLLI